MTNHAIINAQAEELKAESEIFYLKINSTVIPRMNLADFQNAVPLLRELSIINETRDDFKSLQVTVTSDPSFLKPKIWHIDQIKAGQTIRISDLNLDIDGSMLGRLTEAEKSIIIFKLTSCTKELVEHAISESALELLPRNQWGGISCMPDMVAAFIQPNDPAIDRVLKQAAEVLRNAGKSASINGYQEGAIKAWELTSAIWNAIGSMNLDYALPPASFEQCGQKIRSPSQIIDSGLATCLDLSLFFCAALEQAGLNPVLIFQNEHAFPGVWLKSEEFSTAVIDDITALRKRIKLKEIILFESTFLTKRPLPAFSFAIAEGEKHICEANEFKFQLAIDISRARLRRIKPLASEHSVTHPLPIENLDAAESLFEDAPELPEELNNFKIDEPLEILENRLIRWQRKLLDLSLRNNLLNFKNGKKSLKLEIPSPGLFIQLLVEGNTLKLLMHPDLMDGNDPRSQAIHQTREYEHIHRQYAIEGLNRKEIFVNLTQYDMNNRLTDLFRDAKAKLQEDGSNTLYVALGFLSWCKENTCDKKYRAPLVLLPVSIEHQSARSGFKLKIHDDEACFNPTLIEMLRQDFELEIGTRNINLLKDDLKLNILTVWKIVSQAIKDIKGWEVAEDIVLSSFSFSKCLMWKDLTDRNEQLQQNPVVKHLINSPRNGYHNDIDFPEIRSLDIELPIKEIFCPLPADSSQLSAVAAGSRGKDFILIGPPGTGKSQTISNLIVQFMAEGKRVLFVSQKMAALDVVYRRLAEVGLGNFCLELHSNKANKVKVLQQLRTSWDSSASVAPVEWDAKAESIEVLRSQLNNYVQRLHHRYLNGLSVYQAMGRVVYDSRRLDTIVVPDIQTSK